MEEALAYIRSGKGPALVHAQCVRMGAHSNSDAHLLYRSEEEVSDAEQYDPVKRLRHHLLTHKILDDDDLQTIEEEINAEQEASSKRAEEAATPSETAIP